MDKGSKIDLIIRQANLGDLGEIIELFYLTVTNICTNDYGVEQIRVWASGSEKKEKWQKRLESQYFLVAEFNNKIVGFGSIEQGEYLDLLYVHKDFLRLGIAGKLLTKLENEANKYHKKEIYSDVSITAKPFFEKHGYVVVKEQNNLVDEVEIINFRMVKEL